MLSEEVVALCYNRFLSLTIMAIAMLIIFKYLTYALCTRADFRLMQFLLLMFSWVVCLVHLSWTLLILEFPARNLRDFPLFRVSLYFKSCPSARCATAADSVCSDLDVFRRQIITVGLIVSLVNYYKVPQFVM
jgi:hypothetical protein